MLNALHGGPPAHVASLGKFLVVGSVGLVVNSTALLLLHDGGRLPLVLASVLASELAIANNFVWNDRWTFFHQRTGHFLNRFLRFNLVALGGLALASATLWLLVSQRGIQILAANLVGVTASTAWNFVGSHAWTWKTRS
jgi:dolichol-phosphate mannosyltransferase